MTTPWNVSLFAFGRPSDPRTFSGYTQSLHRALQDHGALRREFNGKQLRPSDVLRGALAWNPRWPRHPFAVSHRFAWSKRGSDLISARLNRKIRASGDRGAFLQVGTLLWLEEDLGPHYMLTDMTIPQARRAGRFTVSCLSPQELDEAEYVQNKRLSEACHVFVLSEWTAQSVMTDCGVPRDRITVVYAGSNLVIPDGITMPRNPREILFVGIDWERKGGPLLLEAFRHVRATLPDARLTIVGCDPQIDDPGVIIEGWLDKRNTNDREQLARCYLRASCFCLPTTFDPFPNAIIEAASVGLPAIAIDSGSRREAVTPGVTGELVSSADPELLACSLVSVLKDIDKCKRMGQAAQKRAQGEFTWDRVVDRVQQVVATSSAMRVS